MKPRKAPVIDKNEVKVLTEKEDADRGMICRYFSEIFTQSGDLEKIVPNLKFYVKEQRPQDIYTAEYLPFHLYDNDWLVTYVIETIKQQQPAYKMNVKYVKSYVESSPAFNAIRTYYEKDLTKAVIKHLHERMEINVGVNKKGKLREFVEEYDAYFRDNLMGILGNFDVDLKIMETNIEKCADLWRKKVMLQTFENKYLACAELPNLNQKRYEKFKKAHQKIWLQNREYNYYQKYKAILEANNLVTKNMKMGPRRAKMMKMRLAEFEVKFQRICAGKACKKSIFNFNYAPLKKSHAKQDLNPNGVMLKIKREPEKML